MTLVVLLIIAWGAFAFGAVYPWAYWPLFAISAATGIRGFVKGRGLTPGNDQLRLIAIAFVILGICVAAQLISLPRGVIATVSPATDALLQQHDIEYANAATPWHSLSIDRASTVLALAAYATLAALIAGLANALSSSTIKGIVRGIAVIGLLLAIFAVVQRSTGTLKIYGFWSPFHHPYHIYGPFVNRNHFSGWMVMAIPLVLAGAIGEFAHAASNMRGDLKGRVLWLGSPQGSRVMFLVTAVIAMGISLMLGLSRSGIIAFSVTMLVLLVALVRGQAGGRGIQLTALAIVALVATAAFGWIGTDTIVERFLTGESISGRLIGWRGALTIASVFPLAGSGLNTYKTAMLYHSTRLPGDKWWDAAHNDYLQVASEGGLLLLVPIAALIWLVIRRIVNAIGAEQDAQIQWLRIGAAAGLIGIAVQELVDFSLQIPGNAALFAVVCAIALHLPNSAHRHRHHPRTR